MLLLLSGCTLPPPVLFPIDSTPDATSPTFDDAGLVAPLLPQHRPLRLTLRDRVVLPNSTIDQHGRTFTITGLSGITHHRDNEYLAVMDNSNKLIRLRIRFTGEGRVASLNVIGGIKLERTRDHEGIATDTQHPDSVWLSDEGSFRSPPVSAPADLPQVTRYSLDTGKALEQLSLAKEWAFRRTNLGLESLAISADGTTLWTANEEALTLDGPTSTHARGTAVRLFKYRRDGGRFNLRHQYLYKTAPAHTRSASPMIRSGLCDLVSLDASRLLALERSFGFFGPIPSLQTSIFLVEIDDTPVTRPAQTHKRPLWTGAAENMEGLCLGPRLGNASRVVVGITDNQNRLENLIYVFTLDGLDD